MSMKMKSVCQSRLTLYVNEERKTNVDQVGDETLPKSGHCRSACMKDRMLMDLNRQSK